MGSPVDKQLRLFYHDAMKPGMISLLSRKIQQKFMRIIDFYLFSIAVMVKMMRFRQLMSICKSVLYRQMMFTGFDALALIGFLAISVSTLVILEVNNIMGQLGEGGIIYELLVVIVIRQLSSLLTALVVIARSGTAIATELGNMVVHKEIELLNSFGISPFGYLVAPRVMGVVAALFTLTLYFNAVTVLGGAVVANVLYDFNMGYFVNQLIRQLTLTDLVIPVVKSLLFGFAIGLISSYRGLKVKQASTEVPQQTMHAVVGSVVWVVVLNIAITVLEVL